MTDSDVNAILQELRKVHDKVESIYQGLYGVPGTDEKGFCGDLNGLQKDFYDFRRKVIIAVCILGTSGGVGLGIVDVIR